MTAKNSADGVLFARNVPSHPNQNLAPCGATQIAKNTMKKSSTNKKGASPTTQLPPAERPVDLSDLAGFKMPAGQEQVISAKKLFTACPVRKPKKEHFCRTIADASRWAVWPVIELKEDNEMYLVHASLLNELAGEATLISIRLALSVTSEGNPFLWPLRLPGSDGKINSWHASANHAADLARSSWIRCTANHQVGGYDISEAQFVREPQWPEVTDDAVIEVAFRGRMITTLDHPIIRRLRGLD